ncbi:hypothetical protein GLOTRDRAFT_134934 [Gloeophyllum trabeum ATCC 11539]|uniref:Luciferase domain-containing protein n=1 Tax=Gloeophyllum trabeum (strain ATCC 11539 / FP-39264 / Madison 617) TaxID=670483 RepID=S7RZ05_GLOTA|nr:uncharacterized protein GLOTRDRAFT_134934 [Gloeophyllum trabeum ATCC 11539]EPQ60210.1 hypothetical protein GLOTRDRAFT_134934 [Gloeophyllum trabeum ATCC 11539]
MEHPASTSIWIRLGSSRTGSDIVQRLARSPIAALACTAALLGAIWAIRDYREWKNFGTGGTPPNLSGYWRITKLRMVRLFQRRNLRDPAPLEVKAAPTLLEDIPARKGGRPQILPRPLPQRQKPEPIPPKTKARLLTLMNKMHSEYPELLVLRKSQTEGGSTDAIYVKPDLLNRSSDSSILKLEVAHAHPQDASLHLLLSPADAAEVIKAEWGERFPLSYVPDGWIMVYAPRDDEELEIVEKIVRASVKYATGVSI